MSEIFGAHTSRNDSAPETTKAITPASAPAELSPLQLLAQQAKTKLQRTVTYEVEEREGWSASYDTNISLDDYKRYTRSAQGKKKRPEDADMALFSGMALVEHNVGIFVNGKRVTTDDGEDVTFGSDTFLEMFEGSSAVEALISFMGDGHLVSTAGALYKEAGYGEDATPTDPTDA